MSPLSTQQGFPLQAKRICRDSSFVTVMSFGDKLSLPASVSLAVSVPTAELSPAVIFATVYVLRSHT